MIFSGYIFLYVLSNNYGISEVGNFTLIQAILFTISTISVLGLDTLSVKLVPINENNLKFLYFRIILNIFPIALFFSFLLFYLSDNIALFFDKKILNDYLRILSFSIIPLSIINPQILSLPTISYLSLIIVAIIPPISLFKLILLVSSTKSIAASLSSADRTML